MSDDVSPIQDIPAAPSCKEERRGLSYAVQLAEAFMGISHYNRYKMLRFASNEVFMQVQDIDELRQRLDHELEKLDQQLAEMSGKDQEFGF
tara:strand:+ start:350 stop:622 length:273 start_codon:yes stop_codon:yes gene_type:complete